jgi:hypothetical protein
MLDSWFGYIASSGTLRLDMGHHTIEPGSTIAERVMQHRGDTVRAVVARPEADGEDFECKFQIIGIGEGKIRRAVGVVRFRRLSWRCVA